MTVPALGGLLDRTPEGRLRGACVHARFLVASGGRRQAEQLRVQDAEVVVGRRVVLVLCERLEEVLLGVAQIHLSASRRSQARTEAAQTFDELLAGLPSYGRVQ